MRVGFHYHVPAEIRDADGIWMPGYLGRFIDELAKNCVSVVCFLHSPSESQRQDLDYRIEQRNVEFVSIGQHCSVPKRLLRSSEFANHLRWRIPDLDILLVRGPTPLLSVFVDAAATLPTCLLLVGSYVDGVSSLRQPRWRKELIRVWSHINQWQQDRSAKKSLTFVNSRSLFERYTGRIDDLVETRTTTLSHSDFYARADTCVRRPVRLLYAGRYDRSKGLLEIVRALHILVSGGRDVVFDLVGWDDGRTGVMQEVANLGEKLGIGDRIFDHGRKVVGPDLFTMYEAADIYVMASFHEGFPRTIWEAMAHSLPVVATPVGSIPHFVGDAVEFCTPGVPSTIAAAVERLIDDESLRKSRIRSGLALARENTLEIRCQEMVRCMRNWLGENS